MHVVLCDSFLEIFKHVSFERVRVCFTASHRAKIAEVKKGVNLDDKFYLCFVLTYTLQAVLADLSTLKVIPLIQIFLFATAI